VKASELVVAITDCIAKYGDLEIVFDCDSFLTELASVELLNEAYCDPPVLVIYAPSAPRGPNTPNAPGPRP
jgi:hypothetical protein